MNNNLNNLGLAKRAGAIIVGENLVLEGIRKGKVCYCIIAIDAGKNAQKNVSDKCTFYNVDFKIDFTSDEISKAVGKENVKVLGITNKGFKKLLEK